MRLKTPLLAALVAAFFVAVAGCRWELPQPTPAPRETPTAVATAIIEPEETPTPFPSPTPILAATFPITSGEILLRLDGLDRVPLSPTSDLWVVAVLTWEQKGLDRRMPVLELSVRGNSSEPCVKSPCGRKLGLVARWSHNLRHDDRVYQEHKSEPPKSYEHLYAGSGLELGQRLAVGDWSENPGSVDVRIQLFEALSLESPAGLRISTFQGSKEIDSWYDDYRHGCGFGLARLFKGAPWPLAGKRSWWHRDVSAAPWVSVKLLRWKGFAESFSAPCPALED